MCLYFAATRIVQQRTGSGGWLRTGWIELTGNYCCISTLKHRFPTTAATMTPTLPPDLLSALASMDDVSLIQDVLYDLLTPREVEAIAERWEIVKRLDAGMTQRAIRDEVGASVTTISRGSRQLKYGHGGFRAALDALAEATAAGEGSAGDGSGS